MMVRPIVEYASSVWAPHTHTNINQLESIQRRSRAARFCYNNFSRFSSATKYTNYGLLLIAAAFKPQHYCDELA